MIVINETYVKILQTAYRLFAEHGIDKTSLSMIAKEVGISKPAIYYHFPSKDVLIDVLFEEIKMEIDFSKSFSIQDYMKDNFEAKLLADGYRMIEEQWHDDYFPRVMNEYMIRGSRNELKYVHRLHEVIEGFANGFEELLTHGAKLGIISGERITAKAHMLTMVIDNIGNCMLIGLKFNYKEIWEEAVKVCLRAKDK
ncbi:TetR/AcrR family transcriptional regulator [Paenibacillus sp. MZ04-78.2]|uniref:TetR/AcrR family transcriptional regulator n=1 Tax=Paenibacillus sp. MZ04-78.2 TaxID=2962034 RepID=UPI0020B7AD6A|nr:TetR/AcrR family transcriptional regulator [Paenibacillus sp. MZ04-78.2]MCP3775504.1 TetR/AcrR family transcriptional regulator [Paenibacillus sp. MZ04-78.2]